MHARFGEVMVKAGKLDEFVKIFRDEMMPHGRSQKGFKGVTVLADAPANRAVLISYWETEADARAAGQSSGSFQGQINKVAALMDAPPKIEYLKVYHQE